MINIDDIEVEEEICDLAEFERAGHVGILLRKYKAWLTKMAALDSYEANSSNGGEYEKAGFSTYFVSASSGDGEYTLRDVCDKVRAADAMDGPLDERRTRSSSWAS